MDSGLDVQCEPPLIGLSAVCWCSHSREAAEKLSAETDGKACCGQSAHMQSAGEISLELVFQGWMHAWLCMQVGRVVQESSACGSMGPWQHCQGKGQCLWSLKHPA